MYKAEKMDEIVREAIFDVLNDHCDILRIAVKQRAKFEGWLKFELASYLERFGMEYVAVETPNDFGKERADLSFTCDGMPFQIELKTPNTNWKIDGLSIKNRPITKNIDSIIQDTKKLNSELGIIAFVLFPIPHGDIRWKDYLSRISEKTGITISESNCLVHSIYISENTVCDIVICTYTSKYYGFR